MTKRISGIDAAKGLTVLVMPAVHTVMLYSQPVVHRSAIGYFLMFFAEGPGAQLFMFLMGFSVVLAKQKTMGQVTGRAALLFVGGYVLNLLRMVIPAALGILPRELLRNYIVYPGMPDAVSLLLTADILQMAGVSILIIHTVLHSNKPMCLSLILFTALITSAPFMWDFHAANFFADHFIGLAAAGDSRAFFPLFPWLCYPLAGLAAGLWYRRRENNGNSYILKRAAGSGLLAVAAGVTVSALSPLSWDRDFYRAGPGRSLYQTGFVLIWLCVAQVAGRKFAGSWVIRLLSFCSRNITIIYITQWLVISWGTAVSGYQSLGITATEGAILATTTISLCITWLVSEYRRRGLPQTQ